MHSVRLHFCFNSSSVYIYEFDYNKEVFLLNNECTILTYSSSLDWICWELFRSINKQELFVNTQVGSIIIWSHLIWNISESCFAYYCTILAVVCFILPKMITSVLVLSIISRSSMNLVNKSEFDKGGLY